MTTYTAFCQDAGGGGTIWINLVEANTLNEACDKAAEACASDWGYEDADDVHVLGLAEGDVKIVIWEDLGDD